MSVQKNTRSRQASQRFAQISMPPLRFLVASLAVFFLASVSKADDRSSNLPTPGHPLQVKVVVLTTFEIGADTGDTPGEFQFWVERRKMNTIIPLADPYHDIRTDGTGVIGLVTGMATANAASSVMALGTDPRFDLAKAYWILAGVPRIGPRQGGVGAGALADFVVRGCPPP